jgi:hypothetical protein
MTSKKKIVKEVIESNDPQWQYTDESKSLVMRTWPSGRQDSCAVFAQEVQEYLAAGGKIQEPDPDSEYARATSRGTITAEIESLERKASRAMRDVALGNGDDKGADGRTSLQMLKELNEQIRALRDKL